MKQKEIEEEHDAKFDVDYLFTLGEILDLVELFFATAKKDTSKIQIRNREEVYNALTDRKYLIKSWSKGSRESVSEALK
jgi:hypothetical protein